MHGTIRAGKHFTVSESVRDVMIGMADRLTVPTGNVLKGLAVAAAVAFGIARWIG